MSLKAVLCLAFLEDFPFVYGHFPRGELREGIPGSRAGAFVRQEPTLLGALTHLSSGNKRMRPLGRSSQPCCEHICSLTGVISFTLPEYLFS